MKLYTRDQMIQAFNYGKKLEGFDWIGDMIDSLTPIELPSDEEIEKEAKEWWAPSPFRGGVQWVIRHIKQQDNGMEINN